MPQDYQGALLALASELRALIRQLEADGQQRAAVELDLAARRLETVAAFVTGGPRDDGTDQVVGDGGEDAR